jgi:3-hydroxybutyryl-CoA dehydrogenase
VTAPRSVGVLGGGRMGAGIAHAFLLAGADVVVVERDEAAAEAAGRRVRDSIVRSLERGTVGRGAGEHGTSERGAGERGSPERSFAGLEAAFSTATDAAAFVDSELVVEAVPEDRGLKADALARAERGMPADSVLATNTSSISIDDLALRLQRPELFVGLHFFNPVPSSSLVEVVQGAATSPAVVDAARGWIDAIGKTAIVVRDSPGFASSRLGLVLGLEAIRMLEEGVASAEDIDTAMMLGYRHPVGPLRTTDLVGLDVRLDIAEELATRLGDRFTPPALLRRLVEEGKLGRKSGEGFYEWKDDR